MDAAESGKIAGKGGGNDKTRHRMLAMNRLDKRGMKRGAGKTKRKAGINHHITELQVDVMSLQPEGKRLVCGERF